MLGQQAVAVVVKVADQRHIAVHLVELVTYLRHCRRRFHRIDSDPHQLGSSTRQFGTLDGGGQVISRIGIGHRLDDHRRTATEADVGNRGTAGRTLADCAHGLLQDQPGNIATGMRFKIDCLPTMEKLDPWCIADGNRERPLPPDGLL